MRRRFGRGRGGRSSGTGKAAQIDAARALERIVEAGVVGARSLEPATDDHIPEGFAALGTGETEEGAPIAVGFAPGSGGDAALAAVAFGRRLASEGGFDGEVVAVAPQWNIAARRRLGAIGELPFRFRAVVASSLAEGDGGVESDAIDAPALLPAQQVAAAPLRDEDRALFARALAALEGLAAKHGGAVRGVEGGVELVLMARCVAAVRSDAEGLRLDSLLPERGSTRLSLEGLATAMDRLEGLLRKRLNDRRARGGEEGLRAQLLSSLVEAAALRGAVPWPLAGSDPEVLDLVGVDGGGAPAVGALRSGLDLAGLGAILDAAFAVRPALAVVLARVGAPLRWGPLRLLLAAREFDDAVLRVLPALVLPHELFDIQSRRGREPVLEPRAAEAAAVAREPAVERERSGEPERSQEARRRRPARSAAGARYEEVSLFDLENDRPDAAEEAVPDEVGGGRRRRRGRRRGRRGQGPRAEEPAPREVAGVPDAPVAESEGDAEEVEVETTPSRRRRGRGRGDRARAGPRRSDDVELLSTDDTVEHPEILPPLAEDVPEFEEEEAVLRYHEEAEEYGGETGSGEEPAGPEGEVPAGSRVAKAAPEPESEEVPRPRRRRAAIVAHGDRGSVLAALLLARDLRLVEGFWVYPQVELMTFFRSVATDLRDEVPVYLVGFAASPARETIQTASLYRGRLEWFDHHHWPPEDLESLREAIGPENVHVRPGTGSSLAAILEGRTRRSRFSDKLVELATGRFTQHDYERWGRLWWHRLGEVATRSGPQRAEIEPLLIGRPSDLAREAARADVPPIPPEVEFVSQRDFRLVHFGGYVMVVVPVPPELDLQLTARAARERYAAHASVAFAEGGDLVVLGADEVRGRRGLNLGDMVDHLASKHEWIEALPGEDHVARLRVRDLATQPGRIEDVIGEIAMGRSILEG